MAAPPDACLDGTSADACCREVDTATPGTNGTDNVTLDADLSCFDGGDGSDIIRGSEIGDVLMGVKTLSMTARPMKS